MNGRGRRNKGQVGEREMCDLLTKRLGLGLDDRLTRNLDQVRSGGADIILIADIAVEVKRQETLNLKAWWKQTCEQADGERVPVLAYRQNRKKWVFCIPEHFIGVDGTEFVSMNEDVFFRWLIALTDGKR